MPHTTTPLHERNFLLDSLDPPKSTDAVLDEVKAWQCRPLSCVYPLVWMDAYAFGGAKLYVVKVRDNGRVINKAIHLVLAVNLNGGREHRFAIQKPKMTLKKKLNNHRFLPGFRKLL